MLPTVFLLFDLSLECACFVDESFANRKADVCLRNRRHQLRALTASVFTKSLVNVSIGKTYVVLRVMERCVKMQDIDNAGFAHTGNFSCRKIKKHRLFLADAPVSVIHFYHFAALSALCPK